MDRLAIADWKILLVGGNFGAGSSREHAPWALVAWGIRAILSTSFADIFRSNSLKNGLLPIVVDEERHRQLFELVAAKPDVELTVDLEAQVVHLPGDEDLPFDVDPFAKQMHLAGTDELGWLSRATTTSTRSRRATRRGSIRGSARVTDRVPPTPSMRRRDDAASSAEVRSNDAGNRWHSDVVSGP